MTAAVDAVNPDCAEIMVRIPTAIDELDKRETDAQATAAWGSPAAILLHCGVEVPGPSTLPCFTLKNVDWLRDDSDAPTYVFTTYGRDPAVRVTVDSDLASGTNALVALGNAVGSLPAQGACTAAEDVLGTEPAAE
ncbi:uncharacterized protein DUF3515 [Homoserinimonas aerilata]|uniref:Uncharacterized protein DUF3515 n=2 Tax=Homoserinimonas aerilata TaxID=1162970 RepID=A0A542YHW3_9MICO|nr:uncharacterized protein DUF3515 [Homoserinimonas aerilata]